MYRDARQLPVQHLSIRLPRHDTGWAGTVCQAPSKNTWCMVLKRIREERDDAAENANAGCQWSELDPKSLPACLSERGAALNPKAYTIRSRHPFAKSSEQTHGHFAENAFRLPPYSVQAIPFRWTRKDDAQAIADTLALPFDVDREPELAFKTVWVNDFVNQQIMLDTFFGALQPEKSLVFLYVKRTPLADDPRRVLVGVGRLNQRLLRGGQEAVERRRLDAQRRSRAGGPRRVLGRDDEDLEVVAMRHAAAPVEGPGRPRSPE